MGGTCKVATSDVPGQACGYCGAVNCTPLAGSGSPKVVRCAACRLVQTMPAPRFEYSDNQGYAGGYSGRERLFRRFARDFMAFVAPLAPGRRLLEIGCGMGFLLDEAARRGYAPVGVELNRWEVEANRARGHQIVEGHLADAGIPDGSVDVVCMSHVLEHVDSLGPFLREVSRVLVGGGILAVSQPYYNAPLPRLLGRHWYGWGLDQHLWHFDPVALQRALSAAGLERVDVVYNAMYHVWLPRPLSLRPKVLMVQLGAAVLGRSAGALGQGDQFYLAARRPAAQ